jgi:hypothetical protein
MIAPVPFDNICEQNRNRREEEIEGHFVDKLVHAVVANHNNSDGAGSFCTVCKAKAVI